MLILYNGKVGFDSQNTAIAIEEGHIVAAGRDIEVLNLEVASTEKINLAGKTLWPGLTDSHLHFETYSRSLNLVDCETPTLEACLARIADKARTLAPDAWLLGRGWNQNDWGGRFGSAAELDAVTAGHPAFLNDKSLHSAWVNSKALQIAGLTKDAPDPQGGIIQRSKDGTPTGILFETAVGLVQKVIPALSGDELGRYLRQGQEQLIRYGLTGITDFDPLSCFQALSRLQDEQELKLHVTQGIPFDDLDWAIEQGIHSGKVQGKIRWGALKLFADGALGPQTAAMLRTYEGSPSNLGKLQLSADDIFEIGIKTGVHGISLAVHAIGDRATHEVLNGYGMLREYERRNHLAALPHRIEHLQLLHRDNLGKCAEMGIAASMQPMHTTSDMFTADKYWGSRSALAYAFNTLLHNGTALIFGSDAPVESPNPFWGIHAAVTRRRQDGSPSTEGWNPQEKISLAEALAAYTTTPAKLAGIPNRNGTLTSGQVADLLVLPVNPKEINPQQLYTILPERVMIEGEWVV